MTQIEKVERGLAPPPAPEQRPPPPAYDFETKSHDGLITSTSPTSRVADAGNEATRQRRERRPIWRRVLLVVSVALVFVVVRGLVWSRSVHSHGHSHRHGRHHRHRHGDCSGGKFPDGVEIIQPGAEEQLSWQHGSGSGRCNVTRTTAEAIHGHFDLYECLEIQTTAGSVDILITPRATGNEQPAILRVWTTAGSVQVRLAEEFVAKAGDMLRTQEAGQVVRGNGDNEDGEVLQALRRQFKTDIFTTAGSIDVDYIIGNGGAMSIVSASGGITANLVVANAGSNDPHTALKTKSMSGSQRIVLSSLTRLGGRIVQLGASHVNVGSASIDLVYPSEWEGSVAARVLGSSTVTLQGDDLEFDVQAPKHARAHRGQGLNPVLIESFGSGSISFSC